MVIRTPLVSRPSNCLKKYRIFFVFGLLLLCSQIYLAYNFLALERESPQKPGETFIDENDYSRDQEDEGLPKGTRQLKLPPDKQENSSKITNPNKITRVKLDYKILDFVPVCEVTGREAISAITRAQSQMCKEKIVNVTCLSQQNLLYPKILQSTCPHSLGFDNFPNSLGCFKDDKKSRLLPNYYTVLKSTNSPEQCAYLCLQSGFPYAGVQYSIECFCGKEEPSKTHQLPDSSCNMKCPSDHRQTCGGYLTVNVFFTGIKKFKPQDARNSSSKSAEETPVRIAYLLTVNGRASRQVKRLISILYDPSHLYYIHVDRRQDYMYQEMLEIEKNCKNRNIVVAKGTDLRHASIWGGASLLTTFLTSARQMLKHSKNWDFLVNLSESDYPIKTNDQLVEFLTWNKGMNFVKSHGREVQRFLTKQGLDKTFVECEARMWRVGDRKLPHGIQIDGGSDWVALSRDFVEYVAQPEPDPLVSGLLRIFRYTLLPAESFFHTVLRNSKFCDTYIDNNLHVTNWKRKLGCKCQYKAVVDWCGCSPNDFKLEDFGRIRNTAEKNLFFARKFEPVVDQRIIDKVDEWLYPERINNTITTSSSKNYNTYWQSLYYYKDSSPLADDALLSVSNSFARLLYKRLGEPDIVVSNSHLLETTVYFQENHFSGILVKAASDKVAMESSTLLYSDFPDQVEGLIRYKKHLSTSRSWVGKILGLSVNTEYDQKEQMFRNFLGSIGPLSSPVLAYEFDAAVEIPLNLTVLWLDPNNKIACVSNILIEDSSMIGHLKPELNDPIVVGTWRVYVLLEIKLIAKLNFLVTPLTHWKNRPIDMTKSRELNFGSRITSNKIEKDVADNWIDVIKQHIPVIGSNKINDSEIKTSAQLNQWIDTLIKEHYKIIDVCNVSKDLKYKKKKKNTKFTLQQCVSVGWSSLSPDPKSDFHSLCQS